MSTGKPILIRETMVDGNSDGIDNDGSDKGGNGTKVDNMLRSWLQFIINFRSV